jgi:hypothetical protein
MVWRVFGMIDQPPHGPLVELEDGLAWEPAPDAVKQIAPAGTPS